MRNRAWFAAGAALLASVGPLGPSAVGQSPAGPGMFQQAYYAPAPQGPYAASPADLVDAHGNRAVLPAQYCEQGGCGPAGCGPAGCGGYGPGGCGGGYYGGYGPGDCMMDPFGGAGLNTEQVGPHYFDASLEYLALGRDSFSRFGQTFTTLNVLPGGTPVLTDSSIDNGIQSGFRVTGRYDVGPLSVVELGYSGVFDMGNGVTVVDPTPTSATRGDLFSPFTDFGQNPVGGFLGGEPAAFAETDRAVSHTLVIDSDLQTAELSYRRYWVGYSPRVSGTLLTGFRYTKLKDYMLFNTVANGSLDYQIEADNDLGGWQVGGDGWVGIIQGLRMGAETKVGLFNNHYTVDSRIDSTGGQLLAPERARKDIPAFIGELRVMAVADILPSVSLKAGYELVVLNSIATAVDNFNPGSPYGASQGVTRVPFVSDQGSALYQGFSAGMELVW